MLNYYSGKASIMGIERLRDNIEGPGIRSLVLFDYCPLHCEYCLNKMLLESGIKKEFTVEELYDILCIDDPYFEVSDGGVTFGGGEPALQSRFIRDFHNLTNGKWSIMIETSLNVSQEHIKLLAPLVSRFIVDVKDMDFDRYCDYVGTDNSMVHLNLDWLVTNGYASKIYARVPLIPGYNTEKDVESSVAALNELGIKNIETFEYVQTHKRQEPVLLMGSPYIDTPEETEQSEDDEREEKV